MADSKMTYTGNKGFWIHEEFMQLAYCYIYNELNKTQYNIQDKNDLLYAIKFHIDGWSTGIMSLVWNGLSQPDEQTMLQILRNVIITLQNKGAFIPVSELQEISTDDDDFRLLYSRKPFPTADLIKIMNALIEMLQGTWTSTNYSMDINYAY